MTIREYLDELERRLPRVRRRRILAEVEDHLGECAASYEAAGLDRRAAEAEAARSFGEVGAVARGFAREAAIVETRLATALALGAAATFFVFPLYVVPENTLPPATWAVKPHEIHVLQVVSVSLWVASVVLAAASAVVAWSPWSRFAASGLNLALLALAGSTLVSAALVVRWLVIAPGSAWWPLLAAPLAGGCLVISAEATGWAHSRRCRLRA